MSSRQPQQFEQPQQPKKTLSLSSYKRNKKIGQGAFGSVYLCSEVDNIKNKYAMKIIPYRDQEKIHIIEEAKIALKLNHPNIVRGLQFFDDQDQMVIIIIMEYCEGGDLSQFIRTEKNINIKKKILIDIVEGIRYLHIDQKMVHRDLKVGNILRKDGVAKISDLGIARMIKEGGMTVTTVQAGSQWYRAPEMMTKEKYGAQVDIWALGLIFLEVLLSERLTTLLSGLKPPCDRLYFPEEDLMSGIEDQNLRKLIKNMLKKQPKERPQIQQILETLKGKKIVGKQGRTQVEKYKEKLQQKEIIKPITVKSPKSSIWNRFKQFTGIESQQERIEKQRIQRQKKQNGENELKDKISIISIMKKNQYFTSMRQQLIKQCKLSDISELNLNNCQLLEIPIIKTKLRKLTSLELSSNNISRINNLNHFTYLKNLFLNGNLIKKIENIQLLTKLQLLKLDDNLITCLQNLLEMKTLKHLSILNNPLQSSQHNIKQALFLKQHIEQLFLPNLAQDIQLNEAIHQKQ